MDSIDITDSAFTLEVPDTNQIIGSSNMIGGSSNDYTMYIYIGVALLLIVVGMYIFKLYQNKKNTQYNGENLDCPGGFCTINQNSRGL